MSPRRASKPALRLVEDEFIDPVKRNIKQSIKGKFLPNFLKEAEQAGLWFPALFGLGIGLYFFLPVEPPFLAFFGILLVSFMLFATLKRSVFGRVLGVICLCLSAGSMAAKLRTELVAAPVLSGEIGPVIIEAQLRELDIEADGRKRALLAALSIERLRPAATPKYVRLSIRTEMPDTLRIGDHVSVLGVMTSPPAPVAPGAFDFGRQLYFQRIGAVGYAVGPVKKIGAGAAEGLDLRAKLDGARRRIARHIAGHLSGQTAAVAQALIVGEREGLSEDVRQALRDAGLAHMLAISGLHLALVAGGLFFALRAVMAAVPRLALYWPIKSIAAGLGLVGAFGYLLLSGMTVPTQRAFIMTAILFLAMMAGRRALSLRSVAIAAFAVLAMQPEALLSVSFQMSFAAVIALIAAYEAWTRARRRQDNPAPRGMGRKVMHYLGAILFSTLVAEAAIAPFALYHFNQFTLYGLAGNLFAMPVMALLVMPMAVLAVLLMPFGADGPALWAMGQGIDLVLSIAHQVASAPGAVLLVKSPPLASLLIFVLAGLWVCLWRGAWRFLGLPLAVMAALPMLMHRAPDLLIADSGAPLALKDPENGQWLFSTHAGRRFARESWLRRAGQSAAPIWWDDPKWAERHHAFCDGLGCFMTLTDGKAGRSTHIALPRDRAALAEDCRRADLLVSDLEMDPRLCFGPALLIDGARLARDGALAVYFDWDETGRFRPRLESVAQERGERPWNSLGRHG